MRSQAKYRPPFFLEILFLATLSLATLFMAEPSFEIEDCAAKATKPGSATASNIVKNRKNQGKKLHLFSMAKLAPSAGAVETLAKLIDGLGEDIATY